ncbi:MAG: hypothetical protein II817_01850 [Bacteroidales bacterium]|nr:hypothetical protein [Bacteroidales bacterium]
MVNTFPFFPQHDSMDCGPSCLRMIAKYYGRHYTLESLRQKSHISREGVSMLGISAAAEEKNQQKTCIIGFLFLYLHFKTKYPMKRIVEILSRFLQAADASWTLTGAVLSLPPSARNHLIVNNIQVFYNHVEICGKPSRRQSWRLAKELSRLGKNKFIRTLFPQWKRLPFAGTRHAK